MNISIHALLAESDGSPCMIASNIFLFLSTLSLRRATRHGVGIAKIDLAFLSTLSLRRATSVFNLGGQDINDFYPRSPCGERRAGRGHVAGGQQISIHALLAESDTSQVPTWFGMPNFYPRSPCGERHVACGDRHKLRHFYPRSPCGERRSASRYLSIPS